VPNLQFQMALQVGCDTVIVEESVINIEEEDDALCCRHSGGPHPILNAGR
jgi:hypothetical protein